MALMARGDLPIQTVVETEDNPARTGLIHALCAYTIWGFMPLFFKQLVEISALEVVAHRIVWSVPLLLVILWQRKRLGEFFGVMRDSKTLRLMLISSALIATNWLIYIWAIYQNQILAASLGYYLNPLLNVVLGYFFLSERLKPVQWLAVAMAAAGVAVLAIETLATIWISLALAASFGLYGMVRKVAPVKSVPGLTAETTLLFPIAAAFAGWAFLYDASPGLGYSLRTDIYLILGGAITATPLLFFASAAKRLSLATLGFVQYIGPTIQFLLGVFLYNEPLTVSHMICFGLIWAALVLYSGDALVSARKSSTAKA
ncbi:EamA family transporter RarD [Alterisphingorhabdus coralli]|uniref:EamA family transporter RarD n=1 Tax=Alterisphingorhabdus coralli TaxID=3071408 RepID=A0AA97I2F9_9SPHN|nr:EamA family transporter RarD [Parasphingorhabdus sp. SCSIO 66989]WOE76203.1 EamA family transporter RarD [Parasphingorhabdus sp. SCSIO 66989]